MKIKESDGTTVDIFAIYWVDNKCYFLGLYEGYKGLLAYQKDEVIIIDHTIQGKWIVRDELNIHGIYHWSIADQNFLQDILEADDIAYIQFLNIIKSEGLIDPNY